MTMDSLLTVDELSNKLKIGKSTIYRWLHYDYIPYIKLGGAVRFNEAAIERWLKSRERAGKNRLLVENVRW